MPRKNKDQMETTYYIDEIDGRRIGYNNKTKFVIQVGKGRGAYKTKHNITGKFRKAMAKYNELDLDEGHKKRLLMLGAMNPVLMKDFNKGN